MVVGVGEVVLGGGGVLCGVDDRDGDGVVVGVGAVLVTVSLLPEPPEVRPCGEPPCRPVKTCTVDGAPPQAEWPVIASNASTAPTPTTREPTTAITIAFQFSDRQSTARRFRRADFDSGPEDGMNS